VATSIGTKWTKRWTEGSSSERKISASDHGEINVRDEPIDKEIERRDRDRKPQKMDKPNDLAEF
jgi:hypothetical protein